MYVACGHQHLGSPPLAATVHVHVYSGCPKKKSHLTLAHGKVGRRRAAVSVGMDGARGALFAVCRPLAHCKGACLSCALGAAHGKGACLSCALDAAHGKRFCHRVP